MPNLTLSKDEAIEILDGESGIVMYDKIIGTGRWSVHHEIVFLLNAKYWIGRYQIGATETQDQGPWDNQISVIFSEVEPFTKTVT